MRKIAAVIALAGVAAAANAQPRNAIVYGARLAGETTWNFGSIGRVSNDSNPLVFEIGVFFFRAQGVGFSTAVYKTYIDDVSLGAGDAASIVIDPGPAGNSDGVVDDGRVGWFDSGAQTQKVFTNRNAGIPGSGFRISSTADTTDGSAAGGISVKQAGPVGNGNFVTDDGVLGYRFNLTLACTVLDPASRSVLVHTPLSRINSYTSYNALDSNTTSEFKTTTAVDNITVNASWIPAPSALALLGLGGLVAGRRRR